ncbi:OprD family porin [Pseudomonas sp. MAFF212428]|uniref:OprD family porin n=1 Tax=Pseudomonas brassicae TaxID=2708063 RepID=A0A6B3NQX4_9PSED|nr:OprD family porin [Pseudomonas brassicae]NER64083.1 OprD family porin [Pseudomonas brassicae]
MFLTVAAHAGGFLEQSSVSVEARNVYVNRDFRDGHAASSQGASKREEWAQGLILNAQSGYRFKNLSVRLRNSTYRSNYEKFPRDMDETRVIVSYNLSVL